jgi:HlyD family secretion protein
MREQMHVHASVDEADIGLIRDAKKRKMQVLFTVDAYPDDLFEGEIEEIRYSSTTNQNVVTYPVIVGAANPDLKLLPGMTANLSFQVDERKQVVKVPNAALRFYPDPQFVRPEDKKLLEGADLSSGEDGPSEAIMSASDRAEARRARTQRHVWILENDLLKAVEIQVGLSDSRYTELVSGDLKPDQELISGLKK